MQKFQKRIGCEVFKSGGDITRTDFNIRHDVGQGELGIYLYHDNGTKMSLIFRTLDRPLSVLLVLEQSGTTLFSLPVSDKDIFIDWVCQLGEIIYLHSQDVQNVSTLLSDNV